MMTTQARPVSVLTLTKHFGRIRAVEGLTFDVEGWIIVDAEGCAVDADLRRWVDRGIMLCTQPAAEVARGTLLWPTSGGE